MQESGLKFRNFFYKGSLKRTALFASVCVLGAFSIAMPLHPAYANCTTLGADGDCKQDTQAIQTQQAVEGLTIEDVQRDPSDLFGSGSILLSGDGSEQDRRLGEALERLRELYEDDLPPEIRDVLLSQFLELAQDGQLNADSAEGLAIAYTTINEQLGTQLASLEAAVQVTEALQTQIQDLTRQVQEATNLAQQAQLQQQLQQLQQQTQATSSSGQGGIGSVLSNALGSLLGGQNASSLANPQNAKSAASNVFNQANSFAGGVQNLDLSDFKKADGWPEGFEADDANTVSKLIRNYEGADNESPGKRMMVVKKRKCASGGCPTRAWINNNPGNLNHGKFSESRGALAADPRHSLFPSPDKGLEAMADLLTKTSSYRNLTIAQGINRYAPPSENHTQRYISTIGSKTGLNVNGPKLGELTKEQAKKLVAAMVQVEGYKAGEVVIKRDGLPSISSNQENNARLASNSASENTLPFDLFTGGGAQGVIDETVGNNLTQNPLFDGQGFTASPNLTDAINSIPNAVDRSKATGELLGNQIAPGEFIVDSNGNTLLDSI